MISYRVADQFTPFPGGRYAADGPGSGESFREDVLIPHIRKALDNEDDFFLVLDGVEGLPSSFLEEAFGGLLRHAPWRMDQVQQVLHLQADDPELGPYVDLAWAFMSAEEMRQRSHRAQRAPLAGT